MACERIDFLGVPLDILKEEDIEKEILSLLEKNEVIQIVFLSTWDVLKARENLETWFFLVLCVFLFQKVLLKGLSS